jgi:hypothetical protein
MPSYDKTIAMAASFAASLMLVRSLASELLPSEAREGTMPSYNKTIATAASFAALLMLVRSLASELLPSEAREALSAALNSLRSRLTWQHTIVVEEFDG